MVNQCAHYVGDVIGGACALPYSCGEAVSYTAKAVSGTCFTFLSIVTGGKVENYNEKADRTVKAAFILPLMYKGVIKILNKKACGKNFYIIDFKDGFLRKKLDLFDFASNYANQVPLRSSLLGRMITNLQIHVGTRLLYALAAVAAVVSRVVDLILGVIAAMLSVVCFGQVEKLNKFAIANLTVFGVVDDLSKGVRGFVNPGQSYLIK